MTVIVEFPRSKVSKVVRINSADDPSEVIVLPVVRIERHPNEPQDEPEFRGRRRGSRRLMLEKLRQLQLELGRSL